jgi:phosphoglycolate phosphatase-like HAD superfamily hydrolase
MLRLSGIRVVAVTWGFHTAELLRTGSPDFVATTIDELTAITLNAG